MYGWFRFVDKDGSRVVVDRDVDLAEYTLERNRCTAAAGEQIDDQAAHDECAEIEVSTR